MSSPGSGSGSLGDLVIPGDFLICCRTAEVVPKYIVRQSVISLTNIIVHVPPYTTLQKI